MRETQGFLRIQLDCLELPLYYKQQSTQLKIDECIGGFSRIHMPNLSLLISNLAWYSWLIRMA